MPKSYASTFIQLFRSYWNVQDHKREVFRNIWALYNRPIPHKLDGKVWLKTEPKAADGCLTNVTLFLSFGYFKIGIN